MLGKELWKFLYEKIYDLDHPLTQCAWCPSTPDERIYNTIKNIPNINDVFEIGCGNGVNAIALSSTGYNVTAIDIIEGPIEKNIAKQSSVNFQIKDIITSRIDEKYDLVYDRCTFHCWTKEWMAEEFIYKVHSILNPGGYWLSIGIIGIETKENLNLEESILLQKLEERFEVVTLEEINVHAQYRGWLFLLKRKEY